MKKKICDVNLIPLKQFFDERGKIMHMLKKTDKFFKNFGEIHFSVAFPGVIKGWHRRPFTSSSVVVVNGNVKWVLYDDRDKSPTKGEIMEIFLSEDNYFLLQIPKDLTSGYKTIGTEKSIVVNCTDEVHSDEKKINIDPFNNKIPYNWDLIHR